MGCMVTYDTVHTYLFRPEFWTEYWAVWVVYPFLHRNSARYSVLQQVPSRLQLLIVYILPLQMLSAL